MKVMRLALGVLAFISSTYIHGYTIRVWNKMSNTTLNPYDIHVHDTTQWCEDSENHEALPPLIGYFEDAYKSVKCGGTCFDWFTIKGHKFYIPNQCHDVNIEVYDDKVLLNGGQARAYGDVGAFFKDIGTAALAQIENVVKYFENTALNVGVWAKNLGEFIAAEAQVGGKLTMGVVTGDEDLINQSLKQGKSAGVNFGLQSAKAIEKQIKNISEAVRAVYENPERPDYCTFSVTSKHATVPKTIDDPSVIAQDTEGLIPLIKKYAPINYLHSKELYYPIWFDEYFNSPTTRIKSHKTGKEYLRGKVTNERIYEIFKRCEQQNMDLYFENDPCVKYGSNPAVNKNKNGSLSTPQYVITTVTDTKIYIVYIYFYGLNGPYEIGPFEGVIGNDKINDFRNLHESDMEHISIELDKNTKAITRIYFGSHGDTEGFWMDAKSPEIQWEGTHPIVYVAHFGHGNYYKQGEWVRIFGMADDVTDKGQRWEPKLIRVYRNDDPRFAPRTMGPLNWPGRMGEHGIGAASDKGWYTKGPQVGDKGRKKGSDPRICPNRSSDFSTSDAKYEDCIGKYAPLSTIPD